MIENANVENIKSWLEAEYNSLHLEHISEQKESELKDRFIRFYCKFDKRLKRIKREKISVSSIENGGVRLSFGSLGKMLWAVLRSVTFKQLDI